MTKKNTFAKFFLFIITAFIILAAPVRTEAKGINKKSVTLRVNQSCTLKVSGKKAKWSSKNKAIATVSSKGRVKAKKAGKTRIIAKVGNKKYTCKVTVKKAASKKAAASKTTANKTTSSKSTSTNTTSSKSTSSSTVSNRTTNNTSSGSNAGGSSSPVNSMTAQERTIYNAMIAQKRVLPEGMRWTNANYYRWNGGIFSGGYGCSAFAFRVSDAAFGTAPARQHTNFYNIKVGDIVRLENNTHSVIVLSNNGSTLTVAEGNYNSSIHWGREISLSHVRATGTYVMTRY
ncbi:MAG: Ig-like domain-containing protein [Eubacterium sp.]|nr:Ig-like domain-containing protein [Eubacterium sp.]